MVTADKQMAWVPFLQAGLLGVAKLSGPMADRTTRFVLQRRQEWHWGFSSEDPQSVWHGGICYSVKPYVVEVGVSVLYPVLLTTIPAALLWYADRRRFGLHACKKCNYDRRGLPPDAKCPECGTVPDPASK